jgi:hypothetical protein
MPVHRVALTLGLREAQQFAPGVQLRPSTRREFFRLSADHASARHLQPNRIGISFIEAQGAASLATASWSVRKRTLCWPGRNAGKRLPDLATSRKANPYPALPVQPWFITPQFHTVFSNKGR